MHQKVIKPKIQTLKLSILFFILFSATNSFLTMLTYIYEQQNLTAIGPSTIAISYLAFIISTIYAPSCRWPIKNQILLGCACYTLNYSTGIFIPFIQEITLKYVLACLGSAVSGLSAGLLWVSQGRYIHLVCENYGVEKKGQHFGLFGLLYSLSHISAGVITIFGLGLFDQSVYFGTIAGVGLLATIYCAIFINNISQQNCQQTAATDIISTSQINESLLPQPIQAQQPQSMRQIFRYYPKMSSILMLLMIDGICFGIHISQITHLIPSYVKTEEMNLYAGYCNIALGCGASLGGYLAGVIGDRVSRRAAGNLGILGFFIGCWLFVLTMWMQAFWMTLLSSFWWGCFLFYIEGWLFLVCSKEFMGRSQSFSVNKQLGSITCFLFQIIVMFTGNNLNLIVLVGVVSCLAVPAYFSLLKLPKQKKQVRPSLKQEEDIISNKSEKEISQ